MPARPAAPDARRARPGPGPGRRRSAWRSPGRSWTRCALVQGVLSPRVSGLDGAGASEAAEADRLLDVEEAARTLGVSEDWLYRRVARLPFAVRLGRTVRFSAPRLEGYIRSRAGDNPLINKCIRKSPVWTRCCGPGDPTGSLAGARRADRRSHVTIRALEAGKVTRVDLEAHRLDRVAR